MKKWRELKEDVNRRYSGGRLVLWSRMTALLSVLLAVAAFGWHQTRLKTLRDIAFGPQQEIGRIGSVSSQLHIDDYGSRLAYLKAVLVHLESNSEDLYLIRDVIGSQQLRTAILKAFKSVKQIDETKVCRANYSGEEFYSGLAALADADFWRVIHAALDTDICAMALGKSKIPEGMMAQILSGSGYKETSKGYWLPPPGVICWPDEDASHHTEDYACQFIHAVQASVPPLKTQFVPLVRSKIQPLIDTCRSSIDRIKRLGPDWGYRGLMVFGILFLAAMLVNLFSSLNRK